MDWLKVDLIDVINSPLPISLGCELFFLYAFYFISVINNRNKIFFRVETKNAVTSIDSALIIVCLWLFGNVKNWQLDNNITLVSLVLYLIVFIYYEYVFRIKHEVALSHHIRILWVLLLSVIYFKLWVSILVIAFCSVLVMFVDFVINRKKNA